MPRAQFSHADYLGGHPQFPQEKHNGVLVADSGGLHMRGIRELFMIPWSEVVDLAVEGSEEAQKRVTATRLVTMGVFAFAAKKRSGSTYIGVQTRGYSVGFSIDRVGAGEVRAKLAPWIRTPSRIAPPEPSPVGSVADELAKLVALRNQGALTEDEFLAQKARLLNG